MTKVAEMCQARWCTGGSAHRAGESCMKRAQFIFHFHGQVMQVCKYHFGQVEKLLLSKGEPYTVEQIPVRKVDAGSGEGEPESVRPAEPLAESASV